MRLGTATRTDQIPSASSFRGPVIKLCLLLEVVRPEPSSNHGVLGKIEWTIPPGEWNQNPPEIEVVVYIDIYFDVRTNSTRNRR